MRERLESQYCMGVIDLSKCPALERSPGKVSGVWVFRGTRLPLWVVLENVRAGATLDEAADWFEIDRSKLEEVFAFLTNEVNDPLNVRDHVVAG